MFLQQQFFIMYINSFQIFGNHFYDDNENEWDASSNRGFMCVCVYMQMSIKHMKYIDTLCAMSRNQPSIEYR